MIARCVRHQQSVHHPAPKPWAARFRSFRVASRAALPYDRQRGGTEIADRWVLPVRTVEAHLCSHAEARVTDCREC
jgi:hypothetical protein